MNLKNASSRLAAAAFLVLGLLDAPGIMAANPSYAVASRLPPQEGEALFHLHFEADAFFGKEKRQADLLDTHTRRSSSGRKKSRELH